MLITLNEIKKFEEEVCVWLETEGVILYDINIESHRSMNGYIVCWRNSSVEYVLINREEWSRYMSDGYINIRKGDLWILKKK